MTHGVISFLSRSEVDETIAGRASSVPVSYHLHGQWIQTHLPECIQDKIFVHVGEYLINGRKNRVIYVLFDTQILTFPIHN